MGVGAIENHCFRGNDCPERRNTFEPLKMEPLEYKSVGLDSTLSKGSYLDFYRDTNKCKTVVIESSARVHLFQFVRLTALTVRHRTSLRAARKSDIKSRE